MKDKKLHEQYIKALIGRGAVLDCIGKSEQAISDYELGEHKASLIKHSELMADIQCLKGNAYGAMGMYEIMKTNAKDAMRMYKQLGDTIGYTSALLNKAAYHGFKGHYDNEISLLRDAMKGLSDLYCSKKTDRDEQFRMGQVLSTLHNNLGYAYRATGDNDRAMEYYIKSLEIKREISDKSGESATLNNIGMFYGRLGDTDKAISYFKQALDILSYIGDKRKYATVLNNLGYGYRLKRRKGRSLQCFTEALEVQKQIGDRYSEIFTLCNIGDHYNEMGMHKEALRYYEEAAEIIKELNVDESLHILLVDIARIYQKLSQGKKAMNALNEAYTIARKKKDKKYIGIIKGLIEN